MSQLIYNDLKEIFNLVNTSRTPTDALFGTVINVSPLTIEIDGNTEYYPSSVFIVPESLTDREIDVEYNGTNTAIPEGLNFTGKMTIKNGLKAGDHVILMQVQQGQKFLILDRF